LVDGRDRDVMFLDEISGHNVGSAAGVGEDGRMVAIQRASEHEAGVTFG
jgi:hypothetical protein